MATPVKMMIEGVQFVMETVNFMSFIAQEASQVSIMALREATRRGQWSLGQEIIDNVLIASNDKVWEWTLMYGMTWNPSWTAFYCYWYTAMLYNKDLIRKFNEKLVLEIVNEGYDPYEVIDGKRLIDTWITRH